MKLFFQNSKGEERLIAEPLNREEVNKEMQYFESIINEFKTNPNNESKFEFKDKTILKDYSTGESQQITIQELQAIYKKCEELKWI